MSMYMCLYNYIYMYSSKTILELLCKAALTFDIDHKQF